MEEALRLKNEKRKAALKRVRLTYGVATYAAAVLAVLCLIGIVVSVLMLNFGERSYAKDRLLYILAGSFAGGALLMALLTFLFSRLLTAASERELDFRERLDGEESFFVGAGTLLTFGEEGITLHGEEGSNTKSVFVAYEETRYISVCTRRRPREKGTWCVGIEIPVKYLSKSGEDNGEKVLVQADAKARLYAALEKHGLTLLGEQPPKEQGKDEKFTLVKRYCLPDRFKRRTALFMLVFAGACVGGGIALGILLSASVGALLGAVGFVFGIRAIFSYVRAKAVLGIYREGIYWHESSSVESLFLKWNDVEEASLGKKNNYPVITLQCAYGSYSIPAPEGAYECMKEFVKKE